MKFTLMFFVNLGLAFMLFILLMAIFKFIGFYYD